MTILDSSIWIAYLHIADSQHKKAVDLLAQVPQPYLVPEYVISEVCSVLAMRAGKGVVKNFLEVVFHNSDTRVLYCENDLFLETVKYFAEIPEKHLSFTDTMLLSLSSEYSTLTFDKKLEKAIKLATKK